MNSNGDAQTKISDLLKKLKGRLLNFAVRNQQGHIIGVVQDLKPSQKGGVNLVLLPSQETGDSRHVLLNSKYIKKVDLANRSLLIEENLDYQQQIADTSNFSEIENNSEKETASFENPEVVEREVIRLLEEQLLIDRNKHKVGEVIVRKEIETRMVEVPVRREKLIIEQVGAENKQLAEIDIGKGRVTGVELAQTAITEDRPTVKGEFFSPQAASDLLEAIALQKNGHGCAKVRVEIILEDTQYRETYQQMFDRCTKRVTSHRE